MVVGVRVEGGMGWDTGDTTGPGCLRRVLFCLISTGDIAVWFKR